jgi:hypothetical protein
MPITLDEVLDALRGEVIRQMCDPKLSELPVATLSEDIEDKGREVTNEISWQQRPNGDTIRHRSAEIAALAIRLILHYQPKDGA